MTYFSSGEGILSRQTSTKGASELGHKLPQVTCLYRVSVIWWLTVSQATEMMPCPPQCTGKGTITSSQWLFGNSYWEAIISVSVQWSSWKSHYQPSRMVMIAVRLSWNMVFIQNIFFQESCLKIKISKLCSLDFMKGLYAYTNKKKGWGGQQAQHGLFGLGHMN